ncbi:DUF2442 domain-containing protein [Salinispira pacifica]|nr:DUF2442 domain-containing protein [Salinispira pacifica]
MNSVLQVIPREDFHVYVYFSDGHIKLYDASKLTRRGVFQQLSDIKVFMETCTVMNNTLAWDVKRTMNPEECLDLDPIQLFAESIEVDDPLENHQHISS